MGYDNNEDDLAYLGEAEVQGWAGFAMVADGTYLEKRSLVDTHRRGVA